MPRYDYRCRVCDTTFELSRSMNDSSAPADCPSGHSETVKLVSSVAVTGRAGTLSAPAPVGAGGGGCCGGGCGCAN